ncbi:MAG: hypothetical protein WCP60_10205 [bacterium]
MRPPVAISYQSHHGATFNKCLHILRSARYDHPMRRPIYLLSVLCLLVILEPCVQAGASNKKKETFSIRIHGEGSAEDGEKFSVPLVLLDGRKAYLSIMPLLNEHDIKAVYPFRAEDGTGGAYLKLDGHGANLLAEYSIEHMGRGTVLAVMINGRQVVDLLVDKPVRDGVFVIPFGLSMAEEAHLVNGYPIIGHENDPKQKKKKQPFSPTNIMLPPKASDLKKASATPQ